MTMTHGAVRLGLVMLAGALAMAATAAPSLAQDSSPAPAADPAKVAKGKELFATYSCGSCHALADAGASAHVGPALDGNADLSHDFIVNRVTNGQGGMPAFGGQLTPEEIDAVATYVMATKSK